MYFRLCMPYLCLMNMYILYRHSVLIGGLTSILNFDIIKLLIKMTKAKQNSILIILLICVVRLQCQVTETVLNTYY